MPDLANAVATEFEALIHRFGLLAHLAVLALFGIVVPYSKGVDFVDPVAIGAYACLGVLFTAPAAAAPLPSPNFTAALARVILSVAYGEAMAVTLLVTGVVTVYASSSLFFFPDLTSLVETALFGLAMTSAAAALAVWINVRFSSGAARMSMRFVFLGLLLGFFLYSRWLPDVWFEGMVISIAVACLFLFLLWRTTQPVRLTPSH